MEASNTCDVSIPQGNGSQRIQNCTIQVDTHLRLRSSKGIVVKEIDLKEIAGMVICTTNDIVDLYFQPKKSNRGTGLFKPVLAVQIRKYGRSELIKLLSEKFGRPLPIWFTVEQDLAEYFRKNGKPSSFEVDQEKNDHYTEHLKEAKKLDFQPFVVMDGSEKQLPRFHTKIFYSSNGKIIDLNKIKDDRPWGEGLNYKANVVDYEDGTFLIISIAGKEFNETNFYRSVGLDTNKAGRIMHDKNNHILPISCIFEKEDSDDQQVFVAMLLNEGETKLEDELRQGKFEKPEDSDEWEKQVKKYAQQIATAILTLHGQDIMHRNINLKTIVHDKQDKMNLIITSEARFLGQKETAKTVVLNDRNEPENEKPVMRKDDWKKFGVVLNSLFRKNPEQERQAIPLGKGYSDEAMDFLRDLLEEDCEDAYIRSNKWLELPPKPK